MDCRLQRLSYLNYKVSWSPSNLHLGIRDTGDGHTLGITVATHTLLKVTVNTTSKDCHKPSIITKRKKKRGRRGNLALYTAWVKLLC